jgi:hypothetical protein
LSFNSFDGTKRSDEEGVSSDIGFIYFLYANIINIINKEIKIIEIENKIIFP